MRTEHFTSCAGVFEGGGVRAAAYAGAFEAATKAGIRFNRVAGTSAGSIAAAFIAAGGTPETIKAKLLELDLAALQGPADEDAVPFPKPGMFASTLTAIPSGFLRMLGRFVRYSGSFSSEAVREWIEATLREILAAGGQLLPERPIRFSDLSIPLYVVAADVLQRGPKIWSSATTPEDSVAFAVQASCSIPFYFQAVSNDQSVFVDGGTISNLPSHVFPPSVGHPGRFAEKTLAFRLKADPSAPKSKFADAADYVFGIADTVVSSATSIQQSLQTDIYSIEIATADVKSTDFEKMTRAKKNLLFANGQRAVEDFVAREREIVGRHRVATTYVGFDERLLAYVYAISEAQKTVWISDSSTYWLFFIYPIIASAVQRGVVVNVMVQEPPPKDAQKERQRRQSLASLGCDVIEVSALAFTGLVVDYPGINSIAVISSEDGAVGQDFAYTSEVVRLYRSQHDFPVIRNLGNALAAQVVSGGTISTVSQVNIVRLSEQDLYQELRRVPQYVDANFTMEDVPFDRKLRVSQTHIKEYKLLQIDKLIRELESNGFDLFAPCRYLLPDGSFSIITPPVLEITPNGPVIIEGHTRAFFLAQMRKNRFRAVVVSGVREPLPVEPRPFSEMRIADHTMTASAILPNIDMRLFRYIETALHS
ncbi:patatin-like phospholipase family protein [Bradyrhizobium sp. USDA 3315]